MSTFRRYGGLNYSANNNITRSYISNSEQMNVNNYSGQQNSKEVFASHIDMSGNSILHTGTIYFQDGTSISSYSGATGSGSQGATGPQGATGQGITGPQGATGQGITGPQGATGPPGQGSTAINVLESGTSGIYYPVFVGNTGIQQAYINNNNTYSLTYNPGTGTLSAQVINAASDINIKQDIEDLSYDNSIDLLRKLNPVEYKFKNDPYKKRFGFIAQEVEEVFKDDNLGLHYKEIDANGGEKHYLSYLELISPLVKTVNHILVRLDEIDNKIAIIDNKVNRIKKLI